MTVELPGGTGLASDPASPATTSEDLPIVAIRAAARFSKSLEVALADVNLSLPQYRLLAYLSGGPERATALSGRLDVSPPSLTALVDGCVARELVERVTSPEDRRRVLHVITDKGREVLAAADVIAAARLAQVSSALSPSQSRKLIEGLELLGMALDSFRDAKSAESKTPEAKQTGAKKQPAGAAS